MVLTKNYEALRTRNLMNPLLHLQKVCNHPYLMPSGEAMAPRVPAPPTFTVASFGSAYATAEMYEPSALVESSAKLHLVMRMLRRLRDCGHRVLIFSHLVSMLDLIQMALYNEGYALSSLTLHVVTQYHQNGHRIMEHSSPRGFLTRGCGIISLLQWCCYTLLQWT